MTRFARSSLQGAFAALVFVSSLTAQTVPQSINYQGRLTDNTPGQTPFTGTANLSFAIWSALSGGSALWTEPAAGTIPVSVNSGIFNVVLGGNGVPVPPGLFNSSAIRYLEVTVNGETLTPRQTITSTGFAGQAQYAATAADSAQLGSLAAASWQRRVPNPCGANQAISGINADGTVTCIGVPSGSVVNGTTNRIIKFTSPTTGGNSLMFDSGTGVGIGTTAPAYPLTVTSTATGTTGYFESTSAASDGLYGVNAAAAGSGQGAGLVGITSQANNFAAGVWGQNNASNGNGIVGTNSLAAAAGQGSGVMGTSAQLTGAGLFGLNTNANGAGIIGMGNNLGTFSTLNAGSGGAFTGNTFGLYGKSSSAAAGTGVVGAGNTVNPVALAAGSGAAFAGLTTGVYLKTTSSAAAQSVYSDNFGAIVRVNYFDGTTQFKINGAGSVATNVADPADPAGERRLTLVAPEAPEIFLEDYGQGQLIRGFAHVELDPAIAANVIVSQAHPLRVFIQLEENEATRGVVVKNKTGRGFDVVELDGGHSDMPFSWHIVCNRADEKLKGGRISRNADFRLQVMAPPLENLTSDDGGTGKQAAGELATATEVAPGTGAGKR